MKTDFLLELRSEEIPARMQEKAAADLARLFEGELAKAGLKASGIESFVTPRRLALIARGLPEATEAVSEEIKGPRADAPAQALAGFLGKTGLTRDQLVERTDAKGNAVLFAVIEKAGRPTPDVLAEAVVSIVRGFPWPKAMRWGAASLSTESPRWVRPLQGIVALFGEAVVPVEIAGVASGAATVGHRFHHPGVITIGSAADYLEKLEACHVIVDAGRRRHIVRTGAEAAARAAGLALVPDEGLVAENAGLTEWPVPLLGRFDPAFLAVPREVIQLTMRTNQKYFACTDDAGALAPAFVCTANIEASDGGAAIVAGNAKVLAARLADARFFWEQDRKTKLEDRLPKLKDIVFHEKLGTVADKVERVAKLARWLVEEGIVGAGSNPAFSSPSVIPAKAGTHGYGAAGSEDAASMGSGFRRNDEEGERFPLATLAEQAAKLAKADLVTGMVGEFPELQGVMGGYYARAEGLPDAVADAIRDHYKPVGQGDEVPTAPVTVAVSLADKLDTLFAFFAIGEFPSGSRDPFALRRSALGVLSLLIENDIRLPLIAAMIVGIANVGAAFGRLQSAKEAKAFKNMVETGLVANPGLQDIELKKRDQELDWEGNEVLKRMKSTVLAAPQKLADFMTDRLKVQQREAGVRHDLIDAVFALGGEDDLVRLLARVKALQKFVETDEGANLIAGYRRAANILRAEAKKDALAPLPEREGLGVGSPGAGPAQSGEEPTPDPSLSGREAAFTFPYAPDPAEATLAAALDAQLPLAERAIEAEDFGAAMAALSALRPAIDRFFDEVTVNADIPEQRTARLALLAKLVAAMHKIADFSKIEG